MLPVGMRLLDATPVGSGVAVYEVWSTDPTLNRVRLRAASGATAGDLTPAFFAHNGVIRTTATVFAVQVA